MHHPPRQASTWFVTHKVKPGAPPGEVHHNRQQCVMDRHWWCHMLDWQWHITSWATPNALCADAWRAFSRTYSFEGGSRWKSRACQVCGGRQNKGRQQSWCNMPSCRHMSRWWPVQPAKQTQHTTAAPPRDVPVTRMGLLGGRHPPALRLCLTVMHWAY